MSGKEVRASEASALVADAGLSDRHLCTTAPMHHTHRGTWGPATQECIRSGAMERQFQTAVGDEFVKVLVDVASVNLESCFEHGSGAL